MSHFYTNIQLAGNTILYRGYEDGQPVQSRTHFSPTLYVTSNKRRSLKLLLVKMLNLLTGRYLSDATVLVAHHPNLSLVYMNSLFKLFCEFSCEL